MIALMDIPGGLTMLFRAPWEHKIMFVNKKIKTDSQIIKTVKGFRNHPHLLP
jgi:hypothetical protein